MEVVIGQSLVQNYMHIIFSTKNRMSYLKDFRQKDIFRYIWELCNEKKCQIIKVGGYEDHIHILCLLNKNIALVDLIKFLKSNSSRWIKVKFPELSLFSWQEGYGAFSINPQQTDAVINYIENQDKHHKKTSFQDELFYFLKKYKYDYDERYIWT